VTTTYHYEPTPRSSVIPFRPKFCVYDRVVVTYSSGAVVIAWVRARRYDLRFKSWTYLLRYEGIQGTWFLPECRLTSASDESL